MFGIVDILCRIKADISKTTIDELNRNLLMFYTNTSRSADVILTEQSKGAKEGKKAVVESMHYIKELGYKILECVHPIESILLLRIVTLSHPLELIDVAIFFSGNCLVV